MAEIGLEPPGIAPQRVAVFICPYSKRTNSKTDIAFSCALYGSINIPDKRINIVTAPVIQAFPGSVILLIGFAIIKIFIRIKIIVKMNAINRIVLDYFKNTVDNQLPCLGYTGI